MVGWDLEYAVVDRREAVWDTMFGYFFDRIDPAGNPTTKWAEPAVYEKFDRQPLVSRVMDAGTLVVYDVVDLVATTRQIADGATIEPALIQEMLPASVNSDLIKASQ
jgi:hypothetical protein